MHFRNGAIAFAYVATLLMEYVDEHKVSLSDTINRWVPSLPEASKVTLKMLANQTSGYPDFETDPAWTAAFNADPFQIFTYKERLGYAFRRPVQFPPGKNWSYAHTNFMILGHILSMIGKKPLATLLRQKVLKPMGLTGTTSSETSAMPNPVLHSFSSEREVALHIPPKVTFYEEVDPAEPAAERLELHRGLSPRPEDRDRRGRDLRTRGVQFGGGGARRQRPDLPVDRRLPGPRRPAAHEEMTHDGPRVAGLRFHYVVLTGRRQ
jgi:CubicO group peptidase (beta-lactamase class C family)